MLIKTLYKGFGIFLLSFLIFNATSCRKDLDFENFSQDLRFSQDTLVLDTLMNVSNSETYLVRVYNTSDDDINIPSIGLEKSTASFFRINVDGQGGFELNNIPLRAKDSLSIFVSMAAGDVSSDLVYEDNIILSSNDKEQEIHLLAFVADAEYYYPKDGESSFSFLNDTTLTNNKYHVIYGDLSIKEGKKLNVTQGTKLYFYDNGNITLNSNSQLNVTGELGSPVIFRGFRSDPRYDTLPKQWQGITGNANSLINIDYAVLQGGNTAVELDNATAAINNTKIINSAGSGIWAKNAVLSAENLVISNAGDACLNIENGGDYTLYASSLSNAWNNYVSGVSGINLPLYLANYMTIDDVEERTDLSFEAYNSIFYGRYTNGVYLDPKDGADFIYTFNHCLIKNQDTSLLDLSADGFTDIITDNPLFTSTLFSENDLSLLEDSPAIDAGDGSYISEAPKDIRGVTRNNPPNMGAYE